MGENKEMMAFFKDALTDKEGKPAEYNKESLCEAMRQTYWDFCEAKKDASKTEKLPKEMAVEWSEKNKKEKGPKVTFERLTVFRPMFEDSKKFEDDEFEKLVKFVRGEPETDTGMEKIGKFLKAYEAYIKDQTTGKTESEKKSF